MWRWFRGAHSPKDGECRQLLKVKREVQAETGLKESSDGLWRNKKEDCTVTEIFEKGLNHNPKYMFALDYRGFCESCECLSAASLNVP